MTASEPPVQVAREATSGALTGVRLGRATLSWVRQKPLGAAGAVIVLGMLLVALLAPVIAPYDPVRNAFDRMHVPPSTVHWFGTDQFGRDVLSRLVYGGSHRHARWAGRFVYRGLSGVDVGRWPVRISAAVSTSFFSA